MKNLVLSSMFPLILVPAGALGAQSMLTTPAGYLGTEGMGYKGAPNQNGYCWALGRDSAGRYQSVDGELRGKKMSITEVGYRIDHAFNYTCWERTWKKVQLSLAECDYDRVSVTFAANATSTPQQVFAGAVSWPTLKGTGKPRPWLPSLAFRFSSPYMFAGTSDLLLDYQFSGGDLTMSTNRPQTWSLAYYLDAVYYVERAEGSSTTYATGTSRCGDPSAYGRGSYAASAVISSQTHADTVLVPAMRGKVNLVCSARYLAADSKVVLGVGLAGEVPGLDIGAGCNRLYLDVTLPFNAFVLCSDSRGSAYNPIVFPWSSDWNQRTVWSQAAWLHSGNGICSLSTAQSHRIAPKPAPTPRKLSISSSISNTKAMSLDTRWEVNPITLYKYY